MFEISTVLLILGSLALGFVALIWVLVENSKWSRITTRRTFVLPTDDSAMQFSTELQGVDTGFFLVPDVPVVWVWRNQKLDFERLKLGLQRTLNRVPIAAGRLVIGEEVLEIKVKGSKGCFLVLQQRDFEELPDVSAPASTWSKYGIFDTLIPREPFDKPLLSATLTHFKNGSCLYVNFSHMLMDGAAMSMFMQIWSYETSLIDEVGPCVPEQKERPADVDCDHQFRGAPVQLDEKDKSLYMTFLQAAWFELSIAWHYYTQQVVDFEFSADTWSQVKDQVQAKLQKGQWVSSYEAIMGLVMSCLGKARPASEKLDMRAIVNIRGRSNLFSPRYFGCALGLHEFPVAPTEDSSSMALVLHDTLRTALKEISTLEKTVLIPQYFQTQKPTRFIGRLFGGRLDYVQRARYVLGWEKSSVSDSYIINSWVGYPWLEVTFGTGQDADFMRVPPAFRSPRQCFICNVTKDTYQLRVSLPRWEVQGFSQTLKESGFGFRQTESRNAFWYFPLVDPDFISSCVFSVRHASLGIYKKTAKFFKDKSNRKDRLPSVGEASLY